MLTVKYPDAYGQDIQGNYGTQPGPTYTYGYDAMGRPNQLTDNQATPVTWVNNVQYGAANELRQISYGLAGGYADGARLSYGGSNTETRQYNTRMQLTRLTATGMDIEYRYSATQNNGQITSQSDGQEVVYAYDGLNRLISAVTTGPEWGQSFTYDGFGNRTGATVTKGSAPSSSLSIDPATHRVVGYSYDANGNMMSAPNVYSPSYDVENRLTSASGDSYAYDLGNKRIWKKYPNGNEEIYFYGIGGQKLGTYKLGIYTNLVRIELLDANLYFGGRVIVSRGTSLLRDRLGSNRSGSRYFPYGEEQQTTAQDKDKFGTYYQDGTTGLDYAQNRYYANTLGRFLTPDPSGSADPSDPGSFNLYAYVNGDPINFNDPEGLMACGDLVDAKSHLTVRQILSGHDDLGYLAQVIWHEAGPFYSSDRSAPNNFLKEQLWIGTALMNRYDIANGNLSVYNSAGKAVAPGFGSQGTSLTNIVLEAAGNNQSWGIYKNGSLISSEQAKLNIALTSDIDQGDKISISSGFVESHLSVNTNCYSLLTAIGAAGDVMGGSRYEPAGILLTSWNKGPADGSKAPGEGFTTIPKIRPQGNTWYGFQASPNVPGIPERPRRRRVGALN